MDLVTIRFPFLMKGFFLLCFVLVCGFQVGCKPTPGSSPEVVVFAAASLQDVLQELGTTFERQTGTRVTFNFAGSQVLAQQIIAAPGADVFVSASDQWMDTLETAGALEAETRRLLAANQLVVIAHPQNATTMAKPCDLAGLDFRYLSLGDPRAVPAGKYAYEWMAAQSCGNVPLWQAVSSRIAPAPDVRAALHLVLADPQLVGIVYKTDWMVVADQARLLYEVPPQQGPAIRYVMAQLKDSRHPQEARQWLAFLADSLARETFFRHGFAKVALQ